jgi:hypothetical protein
MALIKTPKRLNDDRIREMAEDMARDVRRTYNNKSGDEYKMGGDIRKSPNYAKIEKLVVGLKSLKNFPANEARDMTQMFNTLHRPIWGKMVKEYLAKPTERNTMYTFYFTTGYRILRGELARIYASTEATEKGIVYKPDKIARKEMILRFIRYYNENLDALIERVIKENERVKKPVQESVVDEVVGVTSLILNGINNIFRNAVEINPISFVSALLSRSYDRKIEKFENVADLYMATVQAYEDYMKLPIEKRKKNVEDKYVRNIEKYNIKMNNLKAKIDHYDQRSIEEAERSNPKPSKNEDKQTTDNDKTPDPKKDDETKKNDTSNDNDGFDF